MNTSKLTGIDKLNWPILKEPSQNSRMPNAEIGGRIGLSVPAVADRIEKMETIGIIKGFSTLIDYDKIGLSMKAWTTFKASKVKHTNLIKKLTTSEIIEWYAITGNDWAIPKIVVSTGNELETLISFHFTSIRKNIHSSNTFWS